MITLEVQLFFYINSVEGATVQYLFLKIPNSVLICKCQEVEDAVTDVVVFEVIHHVSSITLHTWIQQNIVSKCEFLNITMCREILLDRIIPNKNIHISSESS